MAEDMDKATAMADTFEKIQKLPDPVEGVPNLRRVPGYKVYCCGQPTLAGFEAVLTKVCGDIYPKDGKIIWLNLRQEPDLYVNGYPICARPPNKIGEYAELGAITRDIAKAQEVAFYDVCKKRAEDAGGKLSYVDINKKAYEVEVKDMYSLSTVIEKVKEKFPGLVHMRVPICNSAAPREEDFDTICETLVGTSINTPVIVNDQVGLSRATTGCVIACLFKEFQISASFEGLVETVPGMNLNLLKMDTYKMNMDKDALFRGEFEVVKKLIDVLPDGIAAKNVCDKVIDKNGTPKTGGTGIKQLRENIAESKLSYEIMDDAAQAFLKSKIMDNIHKYYYLIAFAGYLRSIEVAARSAASDEAKASFTLTGGKCAIPAASLSIPRKFKDFMTEHDNLRTIVDEGKGDLQWERDVPAESLVNLEALAAKDFQGNLGTIIHDIYQTAHVMFGDMPMGDHKKRAKYRFASKTLMRILPVALRTEVEGQIERKEITLDLYEILGVCTWGQKKV
jgi:protein-tyrosine phosphatase